ncbi:ODA1, partial [Symbiodinium microadriaticum]
NLRHSNEILRLDLTKESRENRRASSTGAVKDITRLQEQSNMYVQRIESERRQIEDLDQAISSYQEKILEQKARMGGINAAWQNNQMIQKQIRVLENRLDKCLLKFNDTLAQNKTLRAKIDEYRREREMAAIIEDSKNAYQARDKAQAEMIALQQHAEKERTEFESEFSELGEMIKTQQTMLEQLRLKQIENSQE